MPKALLIAHHYPPHIGGMELVVQRQAVCLAQHGYHVHVLTSSWSSAPRQETEGSQVEITRVPACHSLENRFFVPFPIFSPRLIPELWRRIGNADIVHIHDVFYMSSWIATTLAAIARKPLVLTQHVTLVEHKSRLVMGVQRMVYASVGRWIFRRSRALIAYNRNVRDFLLARGVPSRRVAWLTNGIDTEKFRPAEEGERALVRSRYGLPQERPLVIFVGRLVEKKGVGILLDAKDSSFDLVFAGPGPVPEQGRLDGVHWLGSLDQDQTAELYRACDIFAFPAIGEIYTLAMQEAMASGLPVVTTDDPAYFDTDLADGVVVCPRQGGCFRKAIHGLLADPVRRRDLGSRCRHTAIRHFNWNANFSGLMDVYAEVLASR